MTTDSTNADHNGGEPSNSPGGGGHPGASGDGGNNGSTNGQGNGNGSGDSVSYSSYQKLLDEKKSLQNKFRETQAELDKRLQAEQDAENKRLEEQGEWKKRAEQLEAERDEWKNKFGDLNSNVTESRKIVSVLEMFPGNVRKEYHHLIDTDEIFVDPDSGRVDESSIKKVAEKFSKAFPELIQRRDGPGIPDGEPQGGKTLSVDEWRKLPPKEKRERYSEVKDKILQ